MTGVKTSANLCRVLRISVLSCSNSQQFGRVNAEVDGDVIIINKELLKVNTASAAASLQVMVHRSMPKFWILVAAHCRTNCLSVRTVPC